jgi:hypothetical protein
MRNLFCDGAGSTHVMLIVIYTLVLGVRLDSMAPLFMLRVLCVLLLALQVLFRPIAMVAPDYQLIAEVMLYSEGFSQASWLAGKVVHLYKLASQQLSQQVGGGRPGTVQTWGGGCVGSLPHAVTVSSSGVGGVQTIKFAFALACG